MSSVCAIVCAGLRSSAVLGHVVMSRGASSLSSPAFWPHQRWYDRLRRAAGRGADAGRLGRAAGGHHSDHGPGGRQRGGADGGRRAQRRVPPGRAAAADGGPGQAIAAVSGPEGLPSRQWLLRSGSEAAACARLVLRMVSGGCPCLFAGLGKRLVAGFLSCCSSLSPGKFHVHHVHQISARTGAAQACVRVFCHRVMS